MALNDDNRTGVPGNADRDPGLDRLYRTAGGENPPAHLDAVILAAAHREARARPRAQPAALRRWYVPVSIAAVVVLSVSLVTLVREEGGEQRVQAPPPAQPPAAQPAARLAPSAPAMSERAQPRPPAATSAPTRAVPREDARADDAPATLGKMTDSVTGGIASPMASQSAGAASTPDAAARSQPQPFRDAPSPVERRAAAPQAAPAEDLAARAPAAAERSVAPMATAPASEPTRSRVMAQARKEAASADVTTPVWHGFEKEPPQKWLERITELRRLERVADADAMLDEFKRRFPSHPLPPGR